MNAICDNAIHKDHILCHLHVYDEKLYHFHSIDNLNKLKRYSYCQSILPYWNEMDSGKKRKTILNTNERRFCIELKIVHTNKVIAAAATEKIHHKIKRENFSYLLMTQVKAWMHITIATATPVLHTFFPCICVDHTELHTNGANKLMLLQ